MMQGSKINTNFYNDVNKVSKVLSKVVLMRRLQERSFTEKPIKRKGTNSHPNNGSSPSSSRLVISFILKHLRMICYITLTVSCMKRFILLRIV